VNNSGAPVSAGAPGREIAEVGLQQEDNERSFARKNVNFRARIFLKEFSQWDLDR